MNRWSVNTANATVATESTHTAVKMAPAAAEMLPPRPAARSDERVRDQPDADVVVGPLDQLSERSQATDPVRVEEVDTHPGPGESPRRDELDADEDNGELDDDGQVDEEEHEPVGDDAGRIERREVQRRPDELGTRTDAEQEPREPPGDHVQQSLGLVGLFDQSSLLGDPTVRLMGGTRPTPNSPASRVVTRRSMTSSRISCDSDARTSVRVRVAKVGATRLRKLMSRERRRSGMWGSGQGGHRGTFSEVDSSVS